MIIIYLHICFLTTNIRSRTLLWKKHRKTSEHDYYIFAYLFLNYKYQISYFTVKKTSENIGPWFIFSSIILPLLCRSEKMISDEKRWKQVTKTSTCYWYDRDSLLHDKIIYNRHIRRLYLIFLMKTKVPMRRVII